MAAEINRSAALDQSPATADPVEFRRPA